MLIGGATVDERPARLPNAVAVGQPRGNAPPLQGVPAPYAHLLLQTAAARQRRLCHPLVGLLRPAGAATTRAPCRCDSCTRRTAGGRGRHSLRARCWRVRWAVAARSGRWSLSRCKQVGCCSRCRTRRRNSSIRRTVAARGSRGASSQPADDPPTESGRQGGAIPEGGLRPEGPASGWRRQRGAPGCVDRARAGDGRVPAMGQRGPGEPRSSLADVGATLGMRPPLPVAQAIHRERRGAAPGDHPHHARSGRAPLPRPRAGANRQSANTSRTAPAPARGPPIRFAASRRAHPASVARSRPHLPCVRRRLEEVPCPCPTCAL